MESKIEERIKEDIESIHSKEVDITVRMETTITFADESEKEIFKHLLRRSVGKKIQGFWKIVKVGVGIETMRVATFCIMISKTTTYSLAENTIKEVPIRAVEEMIKSLFIRAADIKRTRDDLRILNEVSEFRTILSNLSIKSY